MRRRYNKEHYENLIYKLNEKIPNIGIGADVIVGFPGETDERFNNTFNFLEELPLTYLHVFTYSERRNTHAVTLPGRVGISIRKQRSRILRELSDRKKHSFYLKNIGKTHNVLFETAKKDGWIYGFTENYIKTRVAADAGFENKILSTKLTEVIPGIAAGEVLI
jgi:threonylcarbamoyladenosine tRNA methylthiotransferase MtaB